MSEETESQAVVIHESRPSAPVVRERLIAHSNVAIWDSAALEHMGRVGAILADSGLMSDTFLKNGDHDAPRQMVVARCVMVANLARDIEADPLMLMQGCSIIGRKLHLEGKIVNAIIRKRTGVNLRFVFGRWNVDHIEFPERHPEGHEQAGELVDPTFFHNIGERLAVRALDPNDPERFVDGSVGLWKTTRNGSPWSKAGDWRRQLRYRSAPEWARAYEPGAVLGIYSEADGLDDDEMFEPRGKPAKRNLSEKLSGNQDGGEGFDAAAISQTLRHAGQPDPEEQPEHDEDGVVIEAQDEAKSDAPAPPKARDEINGPAPRDVVYMMAGDPVSDAGRVPTYKNGEKHSNCGEKGAADLARYTMHPTPIETPPAEEGDDDGFPGDKPLSASGGETTAADVAEEIDAEWEPLERHEGPAPRGVEYTLSTDTDIGEDDKVQAYEDGEPSRRVALRDFVTLPEYDSHPEPADDYIEEVALHPMAEAMRAEKSFEDIQRKLPDLYKGPDFMRLSYGDKALIRSQIWGLVVEKGFPVEPKDSPSAFRLWADTQADPKVIRSMMLKLRGSLAYGRMTQPQKDNLENTVELVCKHLTEG